MSDEIEHAKEAAAGTLGIFGGGSAGTLDAADLMGAPSGTDLDSIFGADGPGVPLTKPEAHDFDSDPLVVGQITRIWLEQYETDEGTSRTVELSVQTAHGMKLVRCSAYLAGAFLRAAGLSWHFMDPDHDTTYQGDANTSGDARTDATIDLSTTWARKYVIIRFKGLGKAKRASQSPPRLFDLRAFGLITDVEAVERTLREKLSIGAAETDADL